MALGAQPGAVLFLPEAPCRRCWCWGRRGARCCPNLPPQSRFVQGWPGTSPASSLLCGPGLPPRCLPSHRPGKKAGPHQDRAQPQGPTISSSSSHHLLRLPHDLPVGHIPLNLSPHWDGPSTGEGTGQPSLPGKLPHLPQEVHHPGRSPSPFIHTEAITSSRQENRGPGSCETSQHSTG